MRIIELEAVLREITVEEGDDDFPGWGNGGAHPTDWDGDEDSEIVTFVDGARQPNGDDSDSDEFAGNGDIAPPASNGSGKAGHREREMGDDRTSVGTTPGESSDRFGASIKGEERPREVPAQVIGEDEMEIERMGESGNSSGDNHASILEIGTVRNRNSGRHFIDEEPEDDSTDD